MSEELKLTVTDSSQTMNKVKNMRKSYVNAVDWKSNTGQGVESGSRRYNHLGLEIMHCAFNSQILMLQIT